MSDLVTARYLREVPFDPISKSSEWELVRAEPLEDEEFDPEADQGIIDVKCLSKTMAMDGTPYADW